MVSIQELLLRSIIRTDNPDDMEIIEHGNNI